MSASPGKAKTTEPANRHFLHRTRTARQPTVLVVEDRLYHAGVEQQALHRLTLEAAAFVGRPAVDQELLSVDGYARLGHLTLPLRCC